MKLNKEAPRNRPAHPPNDTVNNNNKHITRRTINNNIGRSSYFVLECLKDEKYKYNTDGLGEKECMTRKIPRYDFSTIKI